MGMQMHSCCTHAAHQTPNWPLHSRQYLQHARQWKKSKKGVLFFHFQRSQSFHLGQALLVRQFAPNICLGVNWPNCKAKHRRRPAKLSN